MELRWAVHLHALFNNVLYIKVSDTTKMDKEQ
jgi:hypothetical protein